MDDIHNNRIPRLRHFCAPVPCAYQFRHARDSARDLERRLLADALPLTGPQVALPVREIALILAINTAAPVTFLDLSSSMLALLREQVSGKDKTLSSKQRSLDHARCLLANPSRHLEFLATVAAP
jgi:hypothetical protein